MKQHPKRAFVILLVSMIASVCFSERIRAQGGGGDQSAGFRIEKVNENSMGLWDGKQPVLVYNHGVISSQSAPLAVAHTAYLHPIYGLDGEVLTDDFPKDHDYHRGLYWAWTHIGVGGQEVDSWSQRGIRTQFLRWLGRETHPDRAVIGVENSWTVDGEVMMREQVRIEVHSVSSGTRAIDIELTWAPTKHPVSLRGAEGKSYGGFTFRFGPRSRTQITVPTGPTNEDLLVAKLPWADFSGDFGGDPNRMSGAAIFVSPDHPDFPPTWMTRHYGVLAVGWPGVEAQTIELGKSVSCRYRIWIHRGLVEAAAIERAYLEYRKVFSD